MNIVVHCSVTNSCRTLWDPVDCSTSGFPVPHYLLEFAQVHVHWLGDTIQPSYPLLPPSPSAFNLSQHWGLFQLVGSLHQVAKVLELQHQSPNEYSGLISLRIDWFDLASKGLSRVFSNTIVQMHQFWGTQPSLWFNSHIRTWLLEKP